MMGSEPFAACLADGAALAAFLRERQRLLIGAVGDADALEADAEPGLVHHREHAEHAAVFLADQVADRAALVAHRHGAGRRSMHAELVLDAARVDVVACPERAVGIDQKFRDQEQRNALGARRAHRAIAPARNARCYRSCRDRHR